MASLLADFLGDLLPENIQYYIEWVRNQNEIQATMNFSVLEKKDDFIIIVSKLTEKEESRPCFKISIEQFEDLLQKWKKLGEEKVQEIIIMQENTELIVQGNN